MSETPSHAPFPLSLLKVITILLSFIAVRYIITEVCIPKHYSLMFFHFELYNVMSQYVLFCV